MPLEQTGYIERKVSKRDRRAREVSITESGRETYNRILPVVADLQEDILAGLEAGERETFLRLVGKAIEAAETSG